jgi:hypothetical protein
MTNGIAAKPPLWFWVVAVLSTLWSFGGCFAYYTQVSMTAAQLAQLPAAQQEIWKMMPAWVTAAYAVAVWVGLLGSLALLARKKLAHPLFIVSAIGVVVQFGWVFLGSPILTIMPVGKSLPFPAFIFIVALLLIWFSAMATRRGWLR